VNDKLELRANLFCESSTRTALFYTCAIIDVLLTLILRLVPVLSRRGEMLDHTCANLQELLFCTIEITGQALRLTLHPQGTLLL
jgi:hypothetical protein